MFIRLNQKGQSPLEYAVIIAVVVGAFLAMQKYMERGLQGRLRSSTDQIGPQYSAGNTTATYQTTNAKQVAVETFGRAADASFAQGVSRYLVQTPGKVTRETTADEKINKKLADEKLYE